METADDFFAPPPLFGLIVHPSDGNEDLSTETMSEHVNARGRQDSQQSMQTIIAPKMSRAIEISDDDDDDDYDGRNSEDTNKSTNHTKLTTVMTNAHSANSSTKRIARRSVGRNDIDEESSMASDACNAVADGRIYEVESSSEEAKENEDDVEIVEIRSDLFLVDSH
eukprot:TRINITY_DN5838_c0_g1_i1.p1 TRINITY_DN5838_c0_g1~~TRINITY_DN5838_c0_g1_i1.p1  ORF type:complete len:167 (+),score=47.68 TRINITY_DN5838_c0_g1_i1:99-599(+)